ncbi:protein-disulfide reductase [Hydrogenophaga taeniospiralis CCUG 15921]|uniref:Thiol:disulfide interchange protein DsbD n=1 Tax=Hydrogenophaga taeniospiralis CCUG 15921 TaxID=1281780 RepID=A0A9X4NSD4_9BURK|nr:protein-disulfide reductase DsbD [Hydrogenophaga taeniospiralis]MDG5975219.1 protein-disulfide reductase [Hydrogenophaga taeniospiralis CCUG 15921]
MPLWTRFWIQLLLAISTFTTASCAMASSGADFLPPEQAFAFSSQRLDDHTVQLRWVIAPGYHLYRERIQVQSNAKDVAWKPLQLPPGKDLFDANFNRTMAVYSGNLAADLQLTRGQQGQQIEVSWQGCADEGLCYPPASASLTLDKSVVAAIAPPPTPASSTSLNDFGASLASGSVLKTMGAFLLAGLLLAFTPCVLPMVPILSSLIAGQTGPVSRGKGFALSLSYAIGMALVYAGFGVAAGLAGEGLAAALQNPWVLGAFASLLATLALSMFGVYELQMPTFIQSRATEWSNRFRGGSHVGVFLMGGLSALVVGPCVAAPLAGALVYISQTRDVVLGGSALFSMAMGMSVPLLLVGLSAGTLLPRAGAWMENVKKVFGMMLLGVAIWMVSPVLPPTAHMLAWSVWLLTAAALLGVFDPKQPVPNRAQTLSRTTGVGMAALALLLLVGAASGGDSVLQPLSHLKGRITQEASVQEAATALPFERIHSVDQLNEKLAQAKAQGQTVMLDFYADWCVACKELEAFTFSKPQVRQRLASVRLLQADVTANSSSEKALLKQFGLFGPPGMVFFDAQREPQVTHKVIGFQNADDFMASLDRALP